MASERSGTLLGRAVLTTQSDERLVRLTREGHDAAYEGDGSAVTGRAWSGRPPRRSCLPTAPRTWCRRRSLQGPCSDKVERLEDRTGRLGWRRSCATARSTTSATSLGRTRSSTASTTASHSRRRSPPSARRSATLSKRSAPCRRRSAKRWWGASSKAEATTRSQASSAVTTGAARGLIFRARSALRDALGVLIPLPAVRFLTELGTAEATGGAAAGLGGRRGGDERRGEGDGRRARRPRHRGLDRRDRAQRGRARRRVGRRGPGRSGTPRAIARSRSTSEVTEASASRPTRRRRR